MVFLSPYTGFLKWGVPMGTPKSSIFDKIFHYKPYKPSILRYPHFRKPPYPGYPGGRSQILAATAFSNASSAASTAAEELADLRQSWKQAQAMQRMQRDFWLKQIEELVMRKQYNERNDSTWWYDVSMLNIGKYVHVFMSFLVLQFFIFSCSDSALHPFPSWSCSTCFATRRPPSFVVPHPHPTWIQLAWRHKSWCPDGMYSERHGFRLFHTKSQKLCGYIGTTHFDP